LKHLRIANLETGPSVGASNWLPLRAALGLRAFGLSGYRGGPGETVVPRHAEQGGGAGQHQELYVVLSGRATFEVEGERIDAPAGTLVLVERGEVRHAVAEEPETVVLAAGGRVGEPYEVAPWEYGSRAAYARARGDIDELDRVTQEGISTYGEHPTMLLGRACVEAQRGNLAAARKLLERAYADPDGGEWVHDQAQNEPLLDPVRE
jgi:hypothetical protein